jgi:hypothetical protein
MQKTVLFNDAVCWYSCIESVVGEWNVSTENDTDMEKTKITCPSATLSATNPIRTSLEWNLSLRVQRSAYYCLTHDLSAHSPWRNNNNNNNNNNNLNINSAHWHVTAKVILVLTRSTGPSVRRVAQTVQRLATDWTVRGSNSGGGEIFRTCQDRPWGPPSLLYNGYRVFPGGRKRPRRDAGLSPPSSAEV